MATEAKKKKGAVPGFMVDKAEFTGTEMAIRLGRGIGRGGTIIGLSYIANGTSLKAKKIRKWLGPISLAVGLAGEALLSEKSGAGRLTSGVAQGFTTFGMLDTFKTFVVPGKQTEFGLSGLGRVVVPDQPQTREGTNWMDVLTAMRAGAQEGPVNGIPMGAGGSTTNPVASIMANL